MPKNLQKACENQCFWAHGGSRDGSNMASWPLQPTAEASWSNLPATWRTRWQLAGNLAELGPNCGGFRGGLGDVWGGLGGFGRVPGGSWKSFGQVSAGSRREDEDQIALRRDLEPSWRILGPSWGELGAILGRLGAILGHLGAVLGPSWGRLGAILGHIGGILGPSWAILSDLKAKRRCAQKPTKT